MVQLAMVITGILTGMRSATMRSATRITLVVFAISAAVQTPLVASDSGLDTTSDKVIYGIVNVLSPVVALVIAKALMSRRQRQSVVAG